MKKHPFRFFLLLCGLFVLLGLLTVGASAATTHTCDKGLELQYTVNGTELHVSCKNCGEELGTLSLKSPAAGTLDACDDLEVSDSNKVSSLMKSKKDNLTILYRAVGNDQGYYTNLPCLKGVTEQEYNVYLTTKKNYTTYKSDKTIPPAVLTEPIKVMIQHTCDEYYLQATADGDKLCLFCSACQSYYSDKTISIDLENGASICNPTAPIGVKDNGWSELSAKTRKKDEYIVLYQGRGETAYELSSTPPTAYGTYYAYVAIKNIWENKRDLLKSGNMTSGAEYSIAGHTFAYSAGDNYLEAKCTVCSASTKVYVDTSGAYEANRTDNYNKLNQDFFYEDGWSSQSGIVRYTALFSGTDSTNSNTIKDSLTRPTNPGVYTVKLVMLTDANKLAYSISTKEYPFYITGIDINQCTIKEYKDYSTSEPKVDNGTYIVTNASELAWCANNDAEGMKISLQNDIYFNYMTISDDGSISCATRTVYKWRGFGSEYLFTGTILGNGHTIYGLYAPDYNEDMTAGLILEGYNVTIKDLTIEDSYFNNKWPTGAFVGELRVYECDTTGDSLFENCHSLHNIIKSGQTAGGLVGTIFTDTSSSAKKHTVSFTDCINNSSVTAETAGGIVGETMAYGNDIRNLELLRCTNLGNITANNFAGGIIGWLSSQKDGTHKVMDCINTGLIKSEYCESGIIAYLGMYGLGTGTQKISVSGNINVGELYTPLNSGCMADIIGRCDDNTVYTDKALVLDPDATHKTNYYLEASSAYPSNISGIPEATRLSRSDITSGKVCTLLGGHRKDTHYSNVKMSTCEADGSKSLCCLICGTAVEKVTFTHHGHYQINGNCIYCGSTDPYYVSTTLSASIFSSGSWIIIAVVVVLLGGAGVTAGILKKKKKTA